VRVVIPSISASSRMRLRNTGIASAPNAGKKRNLRARKKERVLGRPALSGDWWREQP
jgi:hypothetical protein